MAQVVDDLQDKPKKILLWSTPRSLSTVLTKCLSFVPDSVIWFEPYVSAMYYGSDSIFPFIPSGFDRQKRSQDIHLPEDVGFDATQISYGWCKKQLEADYLGKKLVFVKAMCGAIHHRLDAIPCGYKHTFLIRHPLKALPSWKRNIYQEATDGPYETFKLSKCPESRMPPGFFFKEAYDLYMHVKEKYDSNPIVIDADDLQTNPGGVLKAYCGAVGIPYSDDLLHWEADDKVVMRWNISRNLLQLSKLDDFTFFDKAFSSSEFCKPSKIPSQDDLTEDDLYCVDFCMPYYEKLYRERLCW